jgi:nucleoside-diphosphate-sugar epimerase
MTPERVLMIGCGYVGREVAKGLLAQGKQVYALTRQGIDDMEGLVSLRGDACNAADLECLSGKDFDAVVYIVSASGHDEHLYQRAYVDGVKSILQFLERQNTRPRRFLYVSSTSVYGQTNGEWVDEESETNPDRFSGRVILDGEAAVERTSIPSVILRLGGIYGPERYRMIQQLLDHADLRLRPEPMYTNRNHRDDCAGAIIHLLQVRQPASIYLGVDNDPAERKEVVYWLANALRAKHPEIRMPSVIETPEMQSTTHQRPSPRPYGGSKRCRNKRLIDSGYTFQYPTFKEGYGSMLREMNLI